MFHKHLVVRILLVGLLTVSFVGTAHAAPGAPDGFRLPFSGVACISQGPRCAGTHYAGENLEAIDFGLTEGTPVYASESGRACMRFEPNGGGYMIRIDHPNGLTSIYAHLRDFIGLGFSGCGPVSKGQRIGSVGRTGSAQVTGPHLHFAVVDRTRSNAPVAIYNIPNTVWNRNINSWCSMNGQADGVAWTGNYSLNYKCW